MCATDTECDLMMSGSLTGVRLIMAAALTLTLLAYHVSQPRADRTRCDAETLGALGALVISRSPGVLTSVANARGFWHLGAAVISLDSAEDVVMADELGFATHLNDHTDWGGANETRTDSMSSHYLWSIDQFFELYPYVTDVVVFSGRRRFKRGVLDYFCHAAPLVKRAHYRVGADAADEPVLDAPDSPRLRSAAHFPGRAWRVTRGVWYGGLRAAWDHTDWRRGVLAFAQANDLDIVVPDVA